jgi:hypothetical protein
VSVVLYVIKNHVYINFSFDFLRLDNVDFKITSPVNSSDGSFFKPFKTLVVRASSDIKHSSCASCFISDKALLIVF